MTYIEATEAVTGADAAVPDDAEYWAVMVAAGRSVGTQWIPELLALGWCEAPAPCAFGLDAGGGQ